MASTTASAGSQIKTLEANAKPRLQSDQIAERSIGPLLRLARKE